MACSVPNHMNIDQYTDQTNNNKEKESNILRNKFHLLKTNMLNAVINKNKS
jgi:hypothetical protein